MKFDKRSKVVGLILAGVLLLFLAGRALYMGDPTFRERADAILGTDTKTVPSGDVPAASGEAVTDSGVVESDDEGQDAAAAGPVVPSFDVVRVEPSGDAVFAGRVEPKWSVELRANGASIGKADANEQGEWAVVIDKPLDTGVSDLTLHAKSPDGVMTVNAPERIAVDISETRKVQPLVVVSRPDAPSDVLQKPEVETDVAALPQAPAAAAEPEANDPSKDETGRPAVTDEAESAAPVAAEDEPDVRDAPATVTDASDPPEGSATQPSGQTTETAIDNSRFDPDPVMAGEALVADEPEQAPPANEVADGAEAGNGDDAAEGAASPAPRQEAVADADIEGTTGTAKPVIGDVAEVDGTSRAGTGEAAADASAADTGIAAEGGDDIVAIVQQPAKSGADVDVDTASASSETEPEAASGSAGTAAVAGDGNGDDSRLEIAIETVEKDEDSQVFVTGRAQPGDSVRAYSDNEVLGDAIADQSGRWKISASRPDDRQGVSISIRADTIDPDTGKPRARAEVRFERLDPGETVIALMPVPDERAASPDSEYDRLIVRKGDNLWRIARKIYGEGVRFTNIYQANQNQIRDPDLIYPGQVFAVPKGVLVEGG